jgi:surface polysaccharide O-acyltransferase-like enzyme
VYAQPAKLGVLEVDDAWVARATASPGSRVAAIDLARLVAAAGVISVHIFPDTDGFETVTEALAPLRVSLFVGVALWFQQQRIEKLGPDATVLGALQHGVLWSRLLVPYCVWSLIYLLSRSVKMMAGGPALDIDWVALVFFGGSALHLYFIPYLLALSLAQVCVLRGSPLLRNPAALALLAVVVCLDALAIANPTYRFYDNLVLWNGLIFSAALKMASEFVGQRGVNAHSDGQVAANIALCTTLYIAACWTHDGSHMLYHGLCALLAAALMALLTVIPLQQPPAWLTWAARASFGIYLSHHLFIEGIKSGLARLGIDLAPYDGVENILLTLAVIAMALAMVAVVRKSAWLGFLLLGESRKA